MFRQEQIDGLKTIMLRLQNNADDLTEARVAINDYCEDVQQFTDKEQARFAFESIGEINAIEGIVKAIVDKLQEICGQMQFERNFERINSHAQAIGEDMDRDEKPRAGF